jgi:hypothetical protein
MIRNPRNKNQKNLDAALNQVDLALTVSSNENTPTGPGMTPASAATIAATPVATPAAMIQERETELPDSLKEMAIRRAQEELMDTDDQSEKAVQAMFQKHLIKARNINRVQNQLGINSRESSPARNAATPAANMNINPFMLGSGNNRSIVSNSQLQTLRITQATIWTIAELPDITGSMTESPTIRNTLRSWINKTRNSYLAIMQSDPSYNTGLETLMVVASKSKVKNPVGIRLTKFVNEALLANQNNNFNQTSVTQVLDQLTWDFNVNISTAKALGNIHNLTFGTKETVIAMKMSWEELIEDFEAALQRSGEGTKIAVRTMKEILFGKLQNPMKSYLEIKQLTKGSAGWDDVDNTEQWWKTLQTWESERSNSSDKIQEYNLANQNQQRRDRNRRTDRSRAVNQISVSQEEEIVIDDNFMNFYQEELSAQEYNTNSSFSRESYSPRSRTNQLPDFRRGTEFKTQRASDSESSKSVSFAGEPCFSCGRKGHMAMNCPFTWRDTKGRCWIKVRNSNNFVWSSKSFNIPEDYPVAELLQEGLEPPSNSRSGWSDRQNEQSRSNNNKKRSDRSRSKSRGRNNNNNNNNKRNKN